MSNTTNTTNKNLIQIHISNQHPLLIFENHLLLSHITRCFVTNKPYWHMHFTYSGAVPTPAPAPAPANALSNSAYPLRLYISPTYTALLLLGRPLGQLDTFVLDQRKTDLYPRTQMRFITPVHPDIRDTLLALGVELTVHFEPQTQVEEITFT